MNERRACSTSAVTASVLLNLVSRCFALASWDRVISHSVAHEFSEATRLYVSVTVDSEAVTVNIDLTSVDDDVSFNE